MSKPEDIPQRILDAALAATDSPFPDDISRICYAILAAEQRERERIAQKVEAYGEVGAGYKNLAAAIRNRVSSHD